MRLTPALSNDSLSAVGPIKRSTGRLLAPATAAKLCSDPGSFLCVVLGSVLQDHSPELARVLFRMVSVAGPR